MASSPPTALDQIHREASLGVDGCPPSAGVARRLYRRIRNGLRDNLRIACLNRSGPKGLGRLAAWVASFDVPPFHGRACLAEMTPRGFIDPRASVSPAAVFLGKNVYIGDGVVIPQFSGGGAVQLHDRVHLYGNSFVDTGHGGKIIIGEGTHIQPGCHLHAHISDIEIGKNVEIAASCGFYPYNHGIEPGAVIMDQPLESTGGISIGDGAWLGYRVTVLQNVTIGAGAVIAAGSVVSRDIPANAIAAGVPAKVLRYRSEMKS
jgi:acetyltransferase-like isoleucine patch superfamily enzyme